MMCNRSGLFFFFKSKRHLGKDWRWGGIPVLGWQKSTLDAVSHNWLKMRLEFQAAVMERPLILIKGNLTGWESWSKKLMSETPFQPAKAKKASPSGLSYKATAVSDPHKLLTRILPEYVCK